MRAFPALILVLAAGCATTNAPHELTSIADEVWARRLDHDPAARAVAFQRGIVVQTSPRESLGVREADRRRCRRFVLRTEDRQQTIESKRKLRHALAARPVAERLRMLDAMREREEAIRKTKLKL